MSYKITITKIELTKKVVKPTWQQVDKEGNYGYPPIVEIEEETTTKILVQRVNELNLANVIKVVNGL